MRRHPREGHHPRERHPARERWRAVPLSARLVTIITVLLLVGLASAGITTLTVLHAHLVQQVDDELTSRGEELAERTVDQLVAGRAQQAILPSNYYLAIQLQGGHTVEIPNPHLQQQLGTPRLPSVDLDDLDRTPTPVTLDGNGSHIHWRAVTYPLSAGGPTVGAVTVALPLVSVDATMASTGKLLVVSGLLIAALGALAAWAAVRRSLRPLREIEATAGAIAAGDLSRRVPAQPPTTEVGSLAHSLNVMLAQIEQSFAAQRASEQRMRRFVSDASHELRTPLSTIRGYGELYRMGGVADVGQAMSRIEAEAKRMGALVEDLLQLARLDEGRPLDLRPVDLTAVAADAVADLRAVAPDRAARVVALTGDGAPAPLTVRADENKIRQVVANLVGNVLQHTPAGTPVEIAVGLPEDGWALLEVRDHGPGIAREDADRVFERFFRVDLSRTRSSGGSGLGLAIVAAIMGTHDGGVRIVPTPGGGTTVQVAMPIAGPREKPPAPAPAPPDAPAPAPPATGEAAAVLRDPPAPAHEATRREGPDTPAPAAEGGPGQAAPSSRTTPARTPDAD
ncbi:sensor histidine kinase [Georgenia thermotolerans]|uniref:histidine kinase n=1 Tax=Georgenia thermotolerans TaxID=527326 RepID=A0A7J5UNN5_9MICO|nr:HAMP domain-containing sensor histidine kinase [Georgenia thermotolerans]KAE8763880.1 HAMP domain-containing protein [Georgenia thermotolerans]